MYTTLDTIKKYLEKRFDDNDCVKIGPIEKEGQTVENLLITLVRVEEETSAKQPTAFRRTSDISGHYANPDVCLNLYILISSHASYEIALQQINNTIYFLNSIYSDDDNISEEIRRLSIELQSPTAEQWNSLWQTLGGKMVPAILYKVRMITISAIESSQEVHYVKMKDGKETEKGVVIGLKSPLRYKYEQGEPLNEKEKEDVELLKVLNSIRDEGILHLTKKELRFLFMKDVTLTYEEQEELLSYLKTLQKEGASDLTKKELKLLNNDNI